MGIAIVEIDGRDAVDLAGWNWSALMDEPYDAVKVSTFDTHGELVAAVRAVLDEAAGGYVASTTDKNVAERIATAFWLVDKLHAILSETDRPSHNRVAMAQLAFDKAGMPCPAPRIPLDRDGKPLAWPDPAQPEWYIDAWNGCYSSYAEVLADLDSWVAKEDERVLAYGERLIDEAEAERRRGLDMSAEEVHRHLGPLA